jgi:N4-gp56 family major capsid protein
MAAIYTNMTGSTELDNSAVLAFAQAFLVSAGQDNVMDQLAQFRQSVGAKSIEMTKFARLAKATTPLAEYDEAGRTTMSDTQILFTPAEFGQAVTTTKLMNLQSGGKVDLAAAQVVGINAGSTTNQLAVNALNASSNVLFNAASEAALAAGDVMTPQFLNTIYNKLSRKNVQKIGMQYVAVLHDDQIHDLRNAVGAGSWQDLNKYSGSVDAVLANEVGAISGFRIVSNNDIVYADQAGAGTVDAYRGLFMGANALGKAESAPLRLTLTGPFDALGRFVNIGWYWVGTYGIVDTDAVYVGVTSSSVGANAA